MALALVADLLMDRIDMRLRVSARALKSKETPQGWAKYRVGEVPHGDIHRRKGPGVTKPVVLIQRQVPPVQVKTPLRDSFQDAHDCP